MFYRHWKKILLSLTAFFWASCENTTSAEGDNGTPLSSSAVENPNSSSATGSLASSSEGAAPESSSEEATSNSSVDAPPEPSSSADVAISSAEGKSSSSTGIIIAPKYGVTMSSSSEGLVAAKYGVVMPSATCERTGKSKLACDDGVTCEEMVKETMESAPCDGDICAKYGVVVVKDTTYKCDDGKVYNVAEFRSKYQILDGAVDLYGCPSDICGDFPIEENLPLYGVSNTITRPDN